MRLILAAAVLGLAAPAAAQTPLDYELLRGQQQLDQMRSIELSNQLMAIEARQRAEQAIQDLQFSRALPPRLPQLPYPSATPPAPVDVSKLPSIPDSMLAASNARVQEASKPRR